MAPSRKLCYVSFWAKLARTRFEEGPKPEKDPRFVVFVLDKQIKGFPQMKGTNIQFRAGAIRHPQQPHDMNIWQPNIDQILHEFIFINWIAQIAQTWLAGNSPSYTTMMLSWKPPFVQWISHMFSSSSLLEKFPSPPRFFLDNHPQGSPSKSGNFIKRRYRTIFQAIYLVGSSLT